MNLANMFDVGPAGSDIGAVVNYALRWLHRDQAQLLPDEFQDPQRYHDVIAARVGR
ncbi:MAG: hypothetical protein P8N50_06055 [Actinomycetota bacterium]|nr:hypothetical protein [Actinomycetota bacterium]